MPLAKRKQNKIHQTWFTCHGVSSRKLKIQASTKLTAWFLVPKKATSQKRETGEKDRKSYRCLFQRSQIALDSCHGQLLSEKLGAFSSIESLSLKLRGSQLRTCSESVNSNWNGWVLVSLDDLMNLDESCENVKLCKNPSPSSLLCIELPSTKWRTCRSGKTLTIRLDVQKKCHVLLQSLRGRCCLKVLWTIQKHLFDGRACGLDGFLKSFGHDLHVSQQIKYDQIRIQIIQS